MQTLKKEVLLAVILVLLLLSGCGSKYELSRQNKVQEEIIIRWMIFGEKSKSSDSVIAAFNSELKKYFSDTTVEFEIVPIQYYEDKWNMKMATNEKLDLVWIGSDVFNYTEEVKKGGFMALDYLLSTSGEQLKEQIPKELWERQMRDGKTYSIPLLGALYRKDYAIVTAKGNMLNYGNLKLIQETNIKSIYTDEDCFLVLEDYLQQLQDNFMLGTGISCDTFYQIAQKGYEGIYGPNSPFVIKIFEETPTVYNKYELDSYRVYFQTMHDWYQKGYIRSDVEEVLAPEKDNGSRAGNVLFLDEQGEAGVVLDQVATKYEAVRIPLQDYKYITYESCRNAVAIPRTTENPKRAVEIVNLLNSERGQEMMRLLCNGFEGRHYIKKGDDRIDRVTDKNGEAIYSVSPYAIGNVFLNYENTANEFRQLKKYNEQAICSPLMGFELDTRMIVLEMEKINLVVDEYIHTLQRGTAKDWDATYKEMIEKMKTAGSDKVVSEMQKQINRFLEEKETNIK